MDQLVASQIHDGDTFDNPNHMTHEMCEFIEKMKRTEENEAIMKKLRSYCDTLKNHHLINNRQYLKCLLEILQCIYNIVNINNLLYYNANDIIKNYNILTKLFTFYAELEKNNLEYPFPRNIVIDCLFKDFDICLRIQELLTKKLYDY
jgi:hypothetical protein